MNYDLEPLIMEEIKNRPRELNKIIFNLFYAIKLVCSKMLFHMSISGNVTLCKNGLLEKKLTIPVNLIPSLEEKQDSVELDFGNEQDQQEMTKRQQNVDQDTTRRINDDSYVFNGSQGDSKPDLKFSKPVSAAGGKPKTKDAMTGDDDGIDDYPF